MARSVSINKEYAVGPDRVILTDYQHNSQHQSNRCVWLSACLLIRSFDSQLGEYLLSKYKMNCKEYEWLRIHAKGASEIKMLI